VSSNGQVPATVISPKSEENRAGNKTLIAGLVNGLTSQDKTTHIVRL
jgi:hypothetical protein